MKLNKYALLAVLLLIPTTAQPMDKAIKATFAFAPTMTIGALFVAKNMFYNYFLKHNPKEITPEITTPDFKEFVHDQCRAVGIQNPENIQVIMQPDQSLIEAEAIGTDKICAGRYTKINYYDKALDPAADKQEASKSLNMLKCFFQHEANHLKNNDYLRLTLAGVVVPCATFLIAARLGKIPALQPHTFPQRHIAAAISGTFLGGLNLALWTRYKNHREQQADNGVQDKKEILQGGIDICKSAMAQNASQDFFHPSNLTRMKKFEERLAKLNNQEQK